MSKKQMKIIGALIAVVVVLLGITLGLAYWFLQGNNKQSLVETPTDPDAPWTLDALKKGRVTVIDGEVQYMAYVADLQAAEEELRSFGEEQRAKYENPKVEKIEKKLEKKYGIFAVNLGEMDVKTAKDVQKAVKYMYKRYPSLRGKLTNITLTNLDTFTSGELAVTRQREYIINESFGVCPFVVKHEIVLSASAFLNREELLQKCKKGAEDHYWPEGMDISTLVVHELGHQVLNAYIMEELAFEHPYYVTEENKDAFSDYIMDGLAYNQTIAKAVVDEAYENWKLSHPGQDFEAFATSISGYAKGQQADGGISYPETVAEAVADIYLNKSKASDASKEIEKVLRGN